MLHELLLALSGISGELFVPYPPAPEEPATFRIPANFPYLHEAERCALERLADLGFHYRSIVTFLDQQRGRITFFQASGVSGGSQPITASATTTGTTAEITAETITNANTAKTKNASQRPRGLFVHALCDAINDALTDYRQTIVESEKRILNKEDDMGGVVPLSHLVSVFGKYHVIMPQLHDLVRVVKQHPEEHFGCRLLNLLNDRCHTGVSELRVIMLRLLHACNGVMYQHLTSWMVYGHLQDPYGEFFVKDWELDDSLIPQSIPHSVAESILFAGKAIAIVRAASRSPRNRNSLPRSLAEQHLKQLLELSTRETFHHADLGTVVKVIRRNVAEWLWQVVLTGEKVVECLEAYRAYFLLGHGAFSLSLVEQFERLWLSRLTATKVSMVRQQELNSLLIRASVGNSAERDPALEHFRFVLPTGSHSPSSSRNLFDDFLLGQPLRLECDVGWPLDLFVTSEDLQKYASAFSFLISLRRTQVRLQRAWVHLSAVYRYGDGSATERNITQSLLPWRVRASMMFFVDCLWDHVQVRINQR
jgi:hypothetical protein